MGYLDIFSGFHLDFFVEFLSISLCRVFLGHALTGNTAGDGTETWEGYVVSVSSSVEESELIHAKGLETPQNMSTAAHSFRAAGTDVCAPGLDAAEFSLSHLIN